MEETSTASEAHGTLSTFEEVHCHKARIFSLLAKAPVVRAWKNALCDGAVYLGKASLPESYADRYFQVFKNQDIRFVTFSIVTAFKETGLDAKGEMIEGSQCHVSLAQREASEFLIVTFFNDYDTIAVLPRNAYWPIEGNENTGNDNALLDEVPGSTLSEHSYSISLLLAYIEDIKRITVNPMHPTTTPFQISLNGRIPRADYPKAIGPEGRKESLKESALRTIHSQFAKMTHPIKIDFLPYQPLLRDFRIIIPSCIRFADGLEAIINYTYGPLDSAPDEDNSYHVTYADYLLTHGITRDPDCAYFVPCRLIPEDWFLTGNPEVDMPKELLDDQQTKDYVFDMDDEGMWVQDIWDIICRYPPVEHPTPAEQKQEIWKKAFPWPEIGAQATPKKALTPQKSQEAEKGLRSKHDSGVGDDRAVKPSDVSLLAAHYGMDDRAVKPSDVSLLAAHYLEKASLGDIEAGKDTE